MNSGSIAFDQAAGYYDDTRRLQPATQAAVIGQLSDELRGRGSCLEVGVGTGRIALDLYAGGVPMVGVDLSPAMLRRLMAKNAGRPPFPLAVADATVLPIADAGVGAALVCHVLHLIESWRTAVDELVRVVRPGGVILVESSQRNGGALGEVSRQFWSLASPNGRPRRGLGDTRELDPLLAGRGFAVRLLPPVIERGETSAAHLIAGLEAGIQSACWGLSETARREAPAATREWARERFEDLEALLPIEQTIVWRAYDAPAAQPVPV